MAETIEKIEEFRENEGWYSAKAGYKVTTNEQTITLAIDDESSCCESWGYFLTEDDPDNFIGAELLGVEVVDRNRSTKVLFTTGYGTVKGDGREIHDLDSGDVMFVDIRTDRGVLQFVAYNAHNGYYGHTASVVTRDFKAEKTL